MQCSQRGAKESEYLNVAPLLFSSSWEKRGGKGQVRLVFMALLSLTRVLDGMGTNGYHNH
jgi:hypothetical protein